MLIFFNTPLYPEIDSTSLPQARTGGPEQGVNNGCSRSSVLQVLHFHCKESNGDQFLLSPSLFFLRFLLIFWIYCSWFSNTVPHHGLSPLICNFSICTNSLYMVYFMLDTCSLLSLLLSNLFCPPSSSTFF